MRIYELGKELGVENKLIIEYLQSIGAEVSTGVNAVDDFYAKKVREKFSSKNKSTSKSASKPAVKPVPGGLNKPQAPKVKAVAVPGGIVKASEKISTPEKPTENLPKEENSLVKKETSSERLKKKKVVAVFNPQYSNTDKGKAYARQRQSQESGKRLSGLGKAVSDTKKPIDPSRLPSKLRPAKDRIPDDEKEKIIPEANAQEPYIEPEVKPEIKPESKQKPEPETKSVKEQAIETPTENHSEPEKKSASKPAVKPVKEKDSSAVKPVKENDSSAVKPSEKKESEAIRSLRKKLVKGSVRVSDIQINRKGQYDSKASSSGRRDSQKSVPSSGFGQRRDQRGNNQSAFSARGKNIPGGPTMQAPSQDTRGRKGKAQRSAKNDKFDKFDRLENENAVAKGARNVKKKVEEEEIKVITLADNVSIKDLASKMKIQPAALIKQLFLQGQVYTLNDIIDFETAETIALESDIICEHEIVIDRIAELLKEEEDPESTLVKRPPVVCVMGHVDHGKTSLLDAIRKTNVTSNEAGGITQAIGAYTVEINGEMITFLDTPGHEAFTAMRMRGARSTDVAILVVAADDGVMPQTIEAINHAKAADIHVIVAVNKIDKPGANIDKVKQELSNQGLTPEDWGGNTIFVPISAKTGENIEQLLEMVILDTEILELRANPNRKARGVVIEAKLDKGRGTVVTLLVQKGTLRVGDHIAMGEAYGKVRAMTNDKGQKVKSAGPSTPVEITGLSAVPNAGETFIAFETDKEAKEFASVYIEENRKKLLAGTKSKMSLEDVFNQMKAGELKNLDIILKADVQGSVEAIKDSLEKLSNDEVVVRIIHSGVGNVNESDAILASASNAIIIAFNVQPDAVAKDTIEREKVDLRKYNVIYNAIDDVEAAMKGMLEPVYEEKVIGHVDVRQTFKSSGVGVIAGSYVTDGTVKRDASVRLSRGEEQLFDGKISSLKRFQDDAKEVRSGFECGIVLYGFSDIKEGDTMEVYEMREVPRA